MVGKKGAKLKRKNTNKLCQRKKKKGEKGGGKPIKVHLPPITVIRSPPHNIYT